ncbi:hypothetical protein SCWH03_50150 [Streptomyces pacificus]|uniref:AP2-like integrase N-terminal domain-containing protein n=1 Tax=Streptomyces pacificus TaxID=2705029 RepID=A0A6A0B221_9ACTN|nr:hypothetical protein SCWH03_50150 [Streptomyces pacificus]
MAPGADQACEVGRWQTGGEDEPVEPVLADARRRQAYGIVDRVAGEQGGDSCPDGKRKQLRKGGFRTADDAEEELTKLL